MVVAICDEAMVCLQIAHTHTYPEQSTAETLQLQLSGNHGIMFMTICKTIHSSEQKNTRIWNNSSTGAKSLGHIRYQRTTGNMGQRADGKICRQIFGYKISYGCGAS